MTDETFERFVRENQDPAVRFAQSYLHDWEEARDAAQEAFIKAHTGLATLKDSEALKGWFYRILANHLKDCLRRRKLRNLWNRLRGETPAEEETAPDPAPSPENQAISTDLKNNILTSVEKLPRRQREVFSMKSLATMTFAQIADALSISDGAAKTHYARAVAALKKDLQQWRDE